MLTLGCFRQERLAHNKKRPTNVGPGACWICSPYVLAGLAHYLFLLRTWAPYGRRIGSLWSALPSPNLRHSIPRRAFRVQLEHKRLIRPQHCPHDLLRGLGGFPNHIPKTLVSFVRYRCITPGFPFCRILVQAKNPFSSLPAHMPGFRVKPLKLRRRSAQKRLVVMVKNLLIPDSGRCGSARCLLIGNS